MTPLRERFDRILFGNHATAISWYDWAVGDQTFEQMKAKLLDDLVACCPPVPTLSNVQRVLIKHQITGVPGSKYCVRWTVELEADLLALLAPPEEKRWCEHLIQSPMPNDRREFHLKGEGIYAGV